MFEGTTAKGQDRVSLSANRVGSSLLLPSAWRSFYFGFYYFAYAPVLGRWAASGRCARQ
jgi:hypothetical protein